MYGKELAPGAKFCGVCGQIVKEESSSGSLPGSEPESFGRRFAIPRGVNRMPQGIALVVGERIVKQYKIGRYTLRSGSIEVIITNKRVIRYEESSWMGMKNNAIDEINIDSVHGNYVRMRRSISIIGLIASVVLFIVSMIALFGNMGGGYYYYKSSIEYLVGFIALALTIIIVISSLKPSLEFGLLGAIGNNALATNVNQRGRLFRQDGNSVIFQFKPTSETTEMLKEIGACIYDLKTLGDAAIEKWN